MISVSDQVALTLGMELSLDTVLVVAAVIAVVIGPRRLVQLVLLGTIVVLVVALMENQLSIRFFGSILLVIAAAGVRAVVITVGEAVSRVGGFASRVVGEQPPPPGEVQVVEDGGAVEEDAVDPERIDEYRL